jgi:FkbM family methyltransferase
MKQWEQIISELKLPESHQTVYVWGAGNTAVLFHQGMLRDNLYTELRITAFLDSKLAGTDFFGFPVYSPEILGGQNPANVYILICTTNGLVFHEIEKICTEKHFPHCLLDAAVLKVRKDEFRKAAGLLDAVSKDMYESLLASRALASEPDPTLYAGESYFGVPEFCRSNPSDIIVDCGAYVGDSAERFIWRMEQFKKYYAMEPEKRNYTAMLKRFCRLNEEWNLPKGKLVAIQAGVDESSTKMDVETRVGGLGSIAQEVSCAMNGYVQFWALDDFFPEGFTFLKADIESYEYRMLCGARKSIRKYHPRIAVCIYHSMIDMYSIPILLKEIEPTYRFALRHHSFGYEETVLYVY